ncbi:MAG: NADH:ubiquinone oxidoreductase subunit 6 [Acidimicrobiales bacterium]|nr:NADH:ubiquinone oxidoreductase subunit 6 [Acidimicrobiales bacterium]
MVAQNVVFGILAAVMILSAWKVVTTKNVVRAVLYLVVVLAGAGAQYLLLASEFIFVVQVIVYIGAIIVLFLFGTMLTRAPIGRDTDLDNDQKWLAALTGLFLLGVVLYVLADAFGDNEIHITGVQRTADVANSMFGPYLIPFEVVSVLLLAALVGAIAIARRD